MSLDLFWGLAKSVPLVGVLPCAMASSRASPRGHAPSSQMVALPRLDNLSPRLLGMQQQGGPLSARPMGMITTRQQRRPIPRHIKKAMRQLWKTDVKRWCEVQDKQIEWGYSPREEAELNEWFTTLDINQSGTVEDNEIRALMEAIGVEVSPLRLKQMFAAINKPVNTRLTKNGARARARGTCIPYFVIASRLLPSPLASCHRLPRAWRSHTRRLAEPAEFVRFMIANADALGDASDLPADAGGGGGSAAIFNPDTRLMMMGYRRQRLLNDVADPAKRRNFNSVQSFNQAYGHTLGESVESAAPPTPPGHEPHPISALPAIAHAAATPRPMPPASPRAPGSQIAPRARRLGSPRDGYDGDGAARPPKLLHTSPRSRGTAGGGADDGAGGGAGGEGAKPLVLPAIGAPAMPVWDDRPNSRSHRPPLA